MPQRKPQRKQLSRAALKRWDKYARDHNATMEIVNAGQSVLIIPNEPWKSPTTIEGSKPFEHRQRNLSVKFRVTAEELTLLQTNAEQAQMSVSEYIRQHTIGGNANGS
jgi:hypothetical protein